MDLPPAAQQPPPPDRIIDSIVLEYSASKMITINHQPVVINELEKRLRSIYEDRRDKTMFIIADGALRYGDIVSVIDAARGAGVTRVGIVTDQMRKGLS